MAQVIHHGEPAVANQLVLTERAYGGQRYAVDIVDCADDRMAALLQAGREDEMVQVIHRARLLMLESQLPMFAGADRTRPNVRLVLHTSHPLPGLRVDDLRISSPRSSRNDDVAIEAEDRIRAAAERLGAQGGPLTVSAVAREARAHKKTVAKVLGTPVHTLKEDLLNSGVHHRPQNSERSAG